MEVFRSFSPIILCKCHLGEHSTPYIYFLFYDLRSGVRGMDLSGTVSVVARCMQSLIGGTNFRALVNLLCGVPTAKKASASVLSAVSERDSVRRFAHNAALIKKLLSLDFSVKFKLPIPKFERPRRCHGQWLWRGWII